MNQYKVRMILCAVMLAMLFLLVWATASPHVSVGSDISLTACDLLYVEVQSESDSTYTDLIYVQAKTNRGSVTVTSSGGSGGGPVTSRPFFLEEELAEGALPPGRWEFDFSDKERCVSLHLTADEPIRAIAYSHYNWITLIIFLSLAVGILIFDMINSYREMKKNR